MLRLVVFPAPVLRRRGQPIEQVTDEVRAVAARMVEVMRAHEGIGLAAPQVGLSWRLFVVDVPEQEGRSASGDPPTATRGPTVFINPVLVEYEGAAEAFEEGCLSLPEIRGDVLRPPIVTVRALGLDGKEFVLRAGGLLARCVQHEYDHIEGVLIIDRMTQMSRLKNRAKVRALEKGANRSASRR
jgi:peptide deformylase